MVVALKLTYDFSCAKPLGVVKRIKIRMAITLPNDIASEPRWQLLPEYARTRHFQPRECRHWFQLATAYDNPARQAIPASVQIGETACDTRPMVLLPGLGSSALA